MTDEPVIFEDYDYKDDLIPTKCVECGGDIYYMGSLGSIKWYRCQDCGMEFSS